MELFYTILTGLYVVAAVIFLFGAAVFVHDDNFAVDKNFVFAVPSMFGIDFNLEFSSQPRRHPDGMKSGDSIGTIANQYSSHSCFFTSTHR